MSDERILWLMDKMLFSVLFFIVDGTNTMINHQRNYQERIKVMLYKVTDFP